MNIAIAGAPKSATTGLFYKVKNSLNGSVLGLFEKEGFAHAAADHDHVVAKFLISKTKQFIEGWDRFDRKIGIIRDPRDWLISGLLYGIFVSSFLQRDKSAAARFVALLEKKAAEPKSVSVLDIIRCANQGEGEDFFEYSRILKTENVEWMDSIMAFFSSHPECYVLRYEDFVEENFSGLEVHLGFALKGSGQVDQRHLRVIRTKRSGDWKNWFLNEDVEFFRPIFGEFMDRFGYTDDWIPAENPHISPEASSIYVRNLVAEREAQARIDERLFSETADMSVDLLKSLRQEIIPALKSRRDLDGKIDDFLLVLHYLTKVSAYHATILSKRELKLSQLNEKLKKVRAKAASLQEEKERLRNSWAWKASKPLRKLVKYWKI